MGKACKNLHLMDYTKTFPTLVLIFVLLLLNNIWKSVLLENCRKTEFKIQTMKIFQLFWTVVDLHPTILLEDKLLTVYDKLFDVHRWPSIEVVGKSSRLFWQNGLSIFCRKWGFANICQMQIEVSSSDIMVGRVLVPYPIGLYLLRMFSKEDLSRLLESSLYNFGQK